MYSTHADIKNGNVLQNEFRVIKKKVQWMETETKLRHGQVTRETQLWKFDTREAWQHSCLRLIIRSIQNIRVNVREW